MCFANAVALIVVVTRIVVNVNALSIFFIIITSLIVFSSENLVLFFAVFLLTLCHFQKPNVVVWLKYEVVLLGERHLMGHAKAVALIVVVTSTVVNANALSMFFIIITPLIMLLKLALVFLSLFYHL